MGYIINVYKNNFLQRFDKDPAIPYYYASDFPGLICEENCFNNSLNTKINYFFYSYKGYRKDKIILFCAGIGPGHTSYLTEIELLCKKGFKVLTLDYMGCGSSDGERMPSVNQPTKDIVELLEHLKLDTEVVIVGHSLGGYTALNVINLTENITKGVIISGFVDIASEMLGFMKLSLLADKVKRFEKKLDPRYGSIDNWKYLKETSDKLLFLHSTDDQMVNYKHNTQKVMKLGNPNIKVLTYEGRKHNPNYSMAAVEFMNESIGGYNSLVAKGELKTLEERQAYFADKPIGKMTEQDPKVWNNILNFIDE